MITALCGGVGGSKLVLGLYRTLPANELDVVVNTADDLEFLGLHVSPDLDTVTYTLAGIAQEGLGWGIEGDSFEALGMLRQYGAPAWFQVGDRDFATHVFRTHALSSGTNLTAITSNIAARLNVHAGILPMTHEAVATKLLVGDEWVEFQEYFVRRRHRDAVSAIRYEGIENASATVEVLDALQHAEVVVLVNSNPALSIFPILSTPDVNDLLVAVSAARVAVSPIVGSDAVSGPAGRLMKLLGHRSSATGVAEAYAGCIDGIVIDDSDAEQVAAIEALGIAVHCTKTVMRTLEDRDRLATETVSFARSLK
jgi:LPPG:FO 2-phospho-L-lactate transferase